jgi:hypothetical protein
MRTRLTLKPGERGSKRLLSRFGDRLVCVRYRYDATARKRLKTVELIVDEADREPRSPAPLAGTLLELQSASRQQPSEEEIDELVVSGAEDESAWEAPVKVHPSIPASFSIPAELAARAAFLARVHHTRGVEEWLRTIIRERIELEENAFAEAKRAIAAR